MAVAATGAAGADAADDAAEKPEDVGWDWVYDDEMVVREREESSVRTEKARREFEALTRSSANIKGHLSDMLEDKHPQGLDAPPGAPPGSGGGRGPGARPGDGPAEQSRSLLLVAERMARGQERHAAFEARRGAQRGAERRARERFAAELEAADVRCSERQQELMENQRRRAFNSAQRRSEQQKTLREFHREEERIWEAYYTKSHGSSHQHSRGPTTAPASGGASAPSLGLPGSPPGSAPGTAPDDGDILRSTSRSHGKYVGQLEQWRQFVAENERRTDAQWKKVLHGANKEDLLGETAAQKFKRRVSQVAIAKHFALKASVAAEPQLPVPNGSAPPLRGTFAFKSTPSSLSRDDTFMSRTATWQTRQLQCSKHAEELEQAGQEHLQGCNRALLEARQRIAVETRARVARASENSRVWMQRNDVASARRADLAVTTDEHLVHKQDVFARKMEDEHTVKSERRANKLAAKAKLAMDVQAAARLFIQKKEEAAQATLAQLGAALAERCQQQNVQHAKRLEEDRYGERAVEAAGRRKAEQEALLLKANAAMASKAERSAAALERERRSALDRERSLRKERSSPAALASEGSPPLQRSRTTGSLLPPLAASASAPALPEPRAAPRRAPAPRPSSSSDGPPEEGSEEGVRSGEEEFLEELGRRSGEWMQELRKQRATLVQF